MSKEETLPIIRRLHRYVYRGPGWVFWAGVRSSAISLVQRFAPGQSALVTGFPECGELLTTSKETK